jgi:peptidoglycan/xylan/chitin deacetylase (PgdA/CDA1 family)
VKYLTIISGMLFLKKNINIKMQKKSTCLLVLMFLVLPLAGQSWIRINQLGYLPLSVKVAVFISTEPKTVTSFSLCDAVTDEVVYKGKAMVFSGEDWGMKMAARLDFSNVVKPGGYYLLANGYRSDPFRIAADVYKGIADYILRYMRQQRCGYNPYLEDSCHTHDGFIVDHPSKTGQVIDVTGGWHDASDYLQYVTTSANAVYQMLFAYLKNPEIYNDNYNASGEEGSNGIPDILDEARWGLDWLIKMNPDSGEMYNQVADDRDHRGFRLPNEDTVSYGKGLYRPVYFVTGKSQGLSRFKNRTTGVSSVAGKFCSAFASGSEVFKKIDPQLSKKLDVKAREAYAFAVTDLGVTQTACNVSPYFYEEDNYADDLELAAWELYKLTGDSAFLIKSDYWGSLEPVTPWIEKDTARHYQFYPFVNLGHANLGQSQTRFAAKYIFFMNKGLTILDDRRKGDPFQVKVPFTWCSNNFVAAALTQHRLYFEATGCNPWGTSMICGLPAGGDFPQFPHSAITLYRGVTTFGGLVDGPVYTRIFKGLKGIGLLRPDPYKVFQNGKVVYHDDIGDYSTNEPTMDGTASLSFYLSSLEKDGLKQGLEKPGVIIDRYGATIRNSINEKNIYLIFSADEYGEGAEHILNVLLENNIKASFFLTGNFLRDPANSAVIKRIITEKHYFGPHSDKHLLYIPWEKRDSLLVTKNTFQTDLKANFRELKKKGAVLPSSKYFLAPYEWYNSAIASWTADMGVQLINLSPGSITNADYTTPDMKNYQSSEDLLNKLKRFEASDPYGLKGAFLLIHLGTDPHRTDKFYNKLEELIKYFSLKGYSFKKL